MKDKTRPLERGKERAEKVPGANGRRLRSSQHYTTIKLCCLINVGAKINCGCGKRIKTIRSSSKPYCIECSTFDTSSARYAVACVKFLR